MRITAAAFNYPVGRMGGAEYQTGLVAQGLAARGHEVTFIGTDTGEESTSSSGPVRVLNLPGWRKVGRSRHRALLEQAISATRPDLCYVRVFEEIAAFSAVCRPLGVPVVSVTTHLLETMPILWSGSLRQFAWYVRSSAALTHLQSFRAVRHSLAHVCNTRLLQQKMQRWFPGKPIDVVYNGQPVPPASDVHDTPTGQVIWVNNLKFFKRPQLFVRLAHRLPAYRFVMVGRMAEGSFGQSIRAELDGAPSNFEYVGGLPLDEANARISQSDLLLYTSLPQEGFGNSFLQAWFRGVPTISLGFDLDGIPGREGVGRLSATFEDLVSDVDELMRDHGQRQEMGRRARAYAVAHHSAEHMVACYEALFEQRLASRGIRTTPTPEPAPPAGTSREA